MGNDSGHYGRIYALSGLGDSLGRGRKSVKKVVSCATSSTPLLDDNPLREWALLINVDTTNYVSIALSEAAVDNEGAVLFPDGGWILINHDMPWTGQVQGIANTAACNIAILEVSLQGQSEPPNPSPPGGQPPGPGIPQGRGC